MPLTIQTIKHLCVTYKEIIIIHTAVSFSFMVYVCVCICVCVTKRPNQKQNSSVVLEYE